MAIRFDFNNMMYESLGAAGITELEVAAMLPQVQQAMLAMEDGRAKMAWRNLPALAPDSLAGLQASGESIRSKFENYVLLGIGGSALGPIAVQHALCPPHYNLLPAVRRKAPRLFVDDNVDPLRFGALLELVDPETTFFNVVSKSGATSETMAQLLIVLEMLKERLGAKAREHIAFTTDKEKGNLNIIAQREDIPAYVIPEGVGGRFCVLSPVGLLPFAACGIDIAALLAGASAMEARAQERKLWHNPPYLAATLQVIALQRGYDISVMMPYADGLRYISDWYAQLWAESLGKRLDKLGNEVFSGQTPVKALGTTDQHSQIQLFTEGPNDKTITLIGVEKFDRDLTIPNLYPDIEGISFLGGHSMGELLAAELRATEYALTKAKRPNLRITLPRLDAYALGELLEFFMLQTAFAGQLLHIDPFDQPGVEEGKNVTYGLMGKKGYEKKLVELENMPARLPTYQL